VLFRSHMTLPPIHRLCPGGNVMCAWLRGVWRGLNKIRDVMCWLRPAKPLFVVWAQRPRERTFVNTAISHGAGGLNIDAVRVGDKMRRNQQKDTTAWRGGNWSKGVQTSRNEFVSVRGRWPANVVHNGSKGLVDVFHSRITLDT